MKARRRRGGVFGWPIAIAAVSIVALIVGLLGEGWEDVIAWSGLGIPVAAIGWNWARRG